MLLQLPQQHITIYEKSTINISHRITENLRPLASSFMMWYTEAKLLLFAAAFPTSAIVEFLLLRPSNDDPLRSPLSVRRQLFTLLPRENEHSRTLAIAVTFQKGKRRMLRDVPKLKAKSPERIPTRLYSNADTILSCY